MMRGLRLRLMRAADAGGRLTWRLWRRLVLKSCIKKEADIKEEADEVDEADKEEVDEVEANEEEADEEVPRMSALSDQEIVRSGSNV